MIKVVSPSTSSDSELISNECVYLKMLVIIRDVYYTNYPMTSEGVVDQGVGRRGGGGSADPSHDANDSR